MDTWSSREELEQRYQVKVLIYDPDAGYLRVQTQHGRRYEIEIAVTENKTHIFKFVGADVPSLAAGDGYYTEDIVLDTALQNAIEFDESYERDPDTALEKWGPESTLQRDAAKVGWQRYIRLLS